MEPVALGIQTPNGMQTLGNVMNAANGMLALKRSAATLPYAGPTAQAQMQQQQATAQGAHLQVGEQQQNYARQLLAGAINNPDVVAGNTAGILAVLKHAEQQGIAIGIPPQQVAASMGPLVSLAETNPKEVREAFIQKLTTSLQGPQQAQAITPSGPVLNNGQQIIPTNVSPTAGPTGAIPGMTTQETLGPGTQMIGNGLTPQYVGSQAAPGPQPTDTPQPTQSQAGPASGLAPGVAAGATALAGSVQNTYAQISQQAETAKANISRLQIIQDRIDKGAYTGVGAQTRATMMGWGQFLGLNPRAMTNANIIGKQVSQMTGMNLSAATDLGKKIAAESLPNSNHTAAANQSINAEIIAQMNMAIKSQTYLAPFAASNDPAALAQAEAKLNSVNDFRAYQFVTGTPHEQARIRASLKTPQEKAQMAHTLQELDSMGFFK